ncbi:hypothetical protein GLE_1591 [Lysobacter enzymogenes]|uniref:Uncharacterized protein n=1 Tax=Lysobacter enzymogenes TaxID=69 RepID=A0A0S2DEF5_LYSEN|nr:hypothetical protein [Lysobacter enzymogenes]ALN56948.1 hypothetical protein GLE_1591 [Lysobacter enzymogenes]QCW25667.1 hypothetical protein FE772_08280 [Lysobacter enzymogenes]
MNETQGYAVFFFPQALEALGEAIRPYLLDGPGGPHVLCKEIDTGGAFTEMTLEGRTSEGRDLTLELMVPGNMVRMIVSAHGEGSFGFGPRNAPRPAAKPVAAAPAPAAVPASSPAQPQSPPVVPTPDAPAPAVPDAPSPVIASEGKPK